MSTMVPLSNTQLAQSVYSPSGSMAPTAVNNYNMPTPVGNYASGYNNPYGGFYNPNAVQGGQQSPGSSILGNASNLQSAGKFAANGFQLPQSTAINNFGASLGFGSGGLAPIPSGLGAADTSFLSAAQTASGASKTGIAGSLGSTSTLSSSLGAAGLGALAGSFLGRIGGNSTGGSIGGGVGAGIGMAIGGPPGAIIGGLIGGIGGGFFGGKKKPTSASEFLGQVGEDGSVGSFSYGAKNAGSYSGYNQSMSQEVADYMTKAKQYLGVEKFTPTSIYGGVNTRHSPSGQPGFIRVNGNQDFGFDPDDPASRQKAIGQAVAAVAKLSGASEDQIKAMADRLAFEATPQGQAQKTMPFIPVQNNQRFAEYMNKFKGGTPNASTVPTVPTA